MQAHACLNYSHGVQRQSEGLRGRMHTQDAALGLRLHSCSLLVTSVPKLARMKPSADIETCQRAGSATAQACIGQFLARGITVLVRYVAV